MNRSPVRGTSLVEALIALVVMAVGMLAALGLQARLRGHADEVRQGLVALQLAQQTLDDAQADWALNDTGPPSPQHTTVEREGARFDVRRTVSAIGTSGWALQAEVRWDGRSGPEQALLQHVLGAGGPSLWAALVEGPLGGSPQWASPTGHAGIPPQAQRLSPQRLWLRASATARWGWLIESHSGRVTHTCESSGEPDLARLAQADAALCTPQSQPSVLVSGHVRLSRAGSADEADDEVPDLGVQLRLTSEPHLSPPVCTVQRQRTVVDYQCAVLLRSPSLQDPSAYWSGRTDLTGLPFGDGGFRVCRHTGDRNGNGEIDNDEHPASYRRVQASLRHQHFLLVPHALPCPRGVVGAGDALRHTATEQHQP